MGLDKLFIRESRKGGEVERFSEFIKLAYSKPAYEVGHPLEPQNILSVPITDQEKDEILLERAIKIVNDHFKADIREIFNEFRDPKLRADIILEIVSEFYGVSVKLIRSKSRDREFTKPRFMAAFLLNKYGNMGQEMIAKELNYSSHTSAHHAIKSINKELDIYEDVRSELNVLESKIIYQSKKEQSQKP